MEKQQIKSMPAGTNKIDELIKWLHEAKSEGATHYEVEWSGDKMWDFRWFRAFRWKSDLEIKQEKINKLKKELNELELKTTN